MERFGELEQFAHIQIKRILYADVKLRTLNQESKLIPRNNKF